MRAGYLTLLALVVLSTSVAAQPPKPEPKYNGKPLAYWVERFQKAEKEEERYAAELALCAFGKDGAPAVQALLVMLDDRSQSYRSSVAHILCEIGPGAKAAVPELVKRVKEKYAEKPREGKEAEKGGEIRELIEILGAIGPDAKDAVPTLITMLEKPAYQLAIIDALCDIGPAAKDALPAIRRVIVESLAPESKSAVYLVSGHLWKIGPAAVPLLLDMLIAPERQTQSNAFEALNKLEPEAIKGAPRLAKWLTHSDPVSRYYAAVLSWKVEKSVAAIPVFAALLKEDAGLLTEEQRSRTSRQDEYAVARKAAIALGEAGPEAKDALPALREAEAMGFLMWYFIESRYHRSENMIYLPGPVAKYYEQVSHRIAVGDAATTAIKKIEAP